MSGWSHERFTARAAMTQTSLSSFPAILEITGISPDANDFPLTGNGLLGYSRACIEQCQPSHSFPVMIDSPKKPLPPTTSSLITGTLRAIVGRDLRRSISSPCLWLTLREDTISHHSSVQRKSSPKVDARCTRKEVPQRRLTAWIRMS
jgi:hypothetical protein